MNKQTLKLIQSTKEKESSTFYEGWCDCNVCMPKRSGRYLVCFKNGTIDIVDFDINCLEEGLFPFGYDDVEYDELGHRLMSWKELKNVSFWQPLPNPPAKL